MTLAELLSEESLRQREFPVTRDQIFLAHAAVCPLPRRVAEAVRGYALQGSEGDQELAHSVPQPSDTRRLAARLLHASPEEIAFVGPTSLALSFVAGGLDFRAGDNVLVYREDYPSNVYPWMALADRGMEVRYLRTRELGVIHPEDVQAQVDARTRLVALAAAHFVTGFRLDVFSLGRFLRERGILFCLDAIQTLGAFPTTVEHVDFLAADAHKWLLGPCGAGILYVRRELQERLRPLAWGWHNVRCPNFVAQEQLVLRPDARRYEAGTQNLLGLAGLHAALELVLELGTDAIAAELQRKRAWLIPALQAQGWSVLNADAPPLNTSGILSFKRPGRDLSALHARLEAAKVRTSLRTDRAGRQYLRLSPHFYNTDEELQRCLAVAGQTAA
jgi:cysteine desulfurase/selenocysteine lyase